MKRYHFIIGLFLLAESFAEAANPADKVQFFNGTTVVTTPSGKISSQYKVLVQNQILVSQNKIIMTRYRKQQSDNKVIEKNIYTLVPETGAKKFKKHSEGAGGVSDNFVRYQGDHWYAAKKLFEDLLLPDGRTISMTIDVEKEDASITSFKVKSPIGHLQLKGETSLAKISEKQFQTELKNWQDPSTKK